MSQETVEIVRASLEAFARGDFGTAFSAHAPDNLDLDPAGAPSHR